MALLIMCVCVCVDTAWTAWTICTRILKLLLCLRASPTWLQVWIETQVISQNIFTSHAIKTWCLILICKPQSEVFNQYGLVLCPQTRLVRTCQKRHGPLHPFLWPMDSDTTCQNHATPTTRTPAPTPTPVPTALMGTAHTPHTLLCYGTN